MEKSSTKLLLALFDNILFVGITKMLTIPKIFVKSKNLGIVRVYLYTSEKYTIIESN